MQFCWPMKINPNFNPSLENTLFKDPKTDFFTEHILVRLNLATQVLMLPNACQKHL